MVACISIGSNVGRVLHVAQSWNVLFFVDAVRYSLQSYIGKGQKLQAVL